uniref:Uncharacterized protein n=1 Tax=Panagrolaimus sp. PS1159 TaxID=55785 RepID=A0AC35GW92_9BILA
MNSSNKSISSSNSSKPNPISAKRIYFSGPYSRQNWSLPDSIIFYIAKNPCSAKLFQKLVQMCKYFFIKNPIIIIKQFYKNEKLEAVLEKIEKRIILSNIISYKFWVTNDRIRPTSKIISSIIPYIYKVDVKKIFVYGQNISFNDFICFSKNVECISFINTNLKNENDSNIPLEKLVETLPKLKKLSINNPDYDRYLITSETMKELIKIKHVPQIDTICFAGLTDTFDIETFYDYMKKNKHTRFYFSFSYRFSNAYLNRLEEIVDEIIETQNHDYKVPCFTVPFPYDNTLKWSKMRKLCFSK